MLKWLFQREVVSETTKNWLFDTFAWALYNFGTDVFYKETQLVAPTDQFFPDKLTHKKTEYIADELFYRVKMYAGMTDWACELRPQEDAINPYVGRFLAIQGVPESPLGTFSHDGQQAIITYDKQLVSQPTALIATFAHELGHYLSTTAETLPPGGEELYEPTTDVIAVFMGFGLFMANNAFNFHQYADSSSTGWYVEGGGYLTEKSLIYALAIFSALKTLNIEAIEPHLKPTLRSIFRRALSDVQNSPKELQGLREIVSLKKQPV